MLRKLTFFILFIFSNTLVVAQIGASQSFDFANSAVNSWAHAIGGVNVSQRNVDNNHFWQNPSALDTGFNNYASYNYNSLFADVGNHTFSYTNSLNEIGQFGFGISYWNYGQMEETDEAGNVIGEFRAADMIINAAFARRFDNFSYGASLKFANSSIADFNSSALLLDIGGQFIHPTEELIIGMVFRNIGFPLRKYTSTTEFSTPFDLQIGASFKPRHMPLRFSTTLHRLYRYDIVYDDPNVFSGFDENGDPIRDEPNDFEKVARHFVVGTELIIADGFNIQAGYNFIRRNELQIQERRGLVGFSFGAMLKVKSLQFAFARSVNHISGATSKLTLTSDLSFITKNRI